MDDRVTTEFLKLAHEEFMAAENGRINALKLWGRDFELKGGPEKWREHVDAIRKDPVGRSSYGSRHKKVSPGAGLAPSEPTK